MTAAAESRAADFARDGYVFYRKLIPQRTLVAMRAQMVDIMRPYCDGSIGSADDLDAAFRQVTQAGQTLRGNIYKMCSRLAALPLLLAEPAIREVVDDLGMRVPVIQAYSILCMEPHETKYLFHPHQDLKQRMSACALAFWIPLSAGRDIGGLAVVPGSHALGPLKHALSPEGHLCVPPEGYAGLST